MIECPDDILGKSEVLKTYYEKWNFHNKPYYLNHRCEYVHNLIDYVINEKNINIDNIIDIMDELQIKSSNDEKVECISYETIGDILKKFTEQDIVQFIKLLENKYKITHDNLYTRCREDWLQRKQHHFSHASAMMQDIGLCLTLLSYYYGYTIDENTTDIFGNGPYFINTQKPVKYNKNNKNAYFYSYYFEYLLDLEKCTSNDLIIRSETQTHNMNIDKRYHCIKRIRIDKKD